MNQWKVACLSILLFFSCGRSYEEEADADNVAFNGGTQSIEANSKLSNSENTIAQRICYSFKTKRTTFSVEKIGSTFDFRLKNISCSDAESSGIISTTLVKDLSSQELRFSAVTQTSYFSQVQTDITGYLEETCTEVLQGRTGYKNLIKESTGYEFSYLALNDSDQVSIKYGSLSESGDSYTVEGVITLKVATANSYGELQGVVSSATQILPCQTSGSKIQTFEQTFLGL